MKINLVLIFTILVCLIYFVLDHKTNQQIDDFLSKQTEQITLLHSYHYKQFKSQSDNEAIEILNKKELISIYKRLYETSIDQNQKVILRDKLTDFHHPKKTI